MIVKVVKDPRFFERQQQVIFPKAEVKLITFEFETVGNDELGKQRAKDLHDQFLANIQDLHGGAIVTFVTQPGEQIENYRVKAEEVAKQQNAQMVLWGRVLADRNGTALINARLMLIEMPPGISAEYVEAPSLGSRGEPVEVRGVIDAPIMQRRIDFRTFENDVTPLAVFLSGLARYYKGAAREGDEARRWLTSSIDHFTSYVGRVTEKMDAAALSQAQLYLARAYVRLAVAEPSRAMERLELARKHAAEASRLNPYDAAVPPVRAVIAMRQRADLQSVRGYLATAARLAPGDSNARVNLAVLESADGKVTEALRQLEDANFLSQSLKQQPLPAVEKLQRALKVYEQAAPSTLPDLSRVAPPSRDIERFSEALRRRPHASGDARDR
jgi:tetratricopeptide (TPR) repeat protein